jgi:hypothetical protein
MNWQIRYDYDYFGDEFDGTFIRKTKSQCQILPAE